MQDNFIPFNEILDTIWDSFRNESINKDRKVVCLEDILNKILINIAEGIKSLQLASIEPGIDYYFIEFEVDGRKEHLLCLDFNYGISVSVAIEPDDFKVLCKEFVDTLWNQYGCIGGLLYHTIYREYNRTDFDVCKVYLYLTQKSVENLKKFDEKLFNERLVICEKNAELEEKFITWYKEKIEKKAQ